MARDVSLEVAILKILDRLSPTPMRRRTLIDEASIALDRELTTEAFTDSLNTLVERGLVRTGTDALGLDNAWITSAGKAALRQQ